MRSFTASLIDVLRMPVLGGIENHHNFAWRETVDGQDANCPPQGARRPPEKTCSGVIPGSMSAPGFVVRGLGNAERDQQRGARRGPPHEPQAGV